MITRGFYGVIDLDDVRGACALAEQLVAGGATTLQLRLKKASSRLLLDVAAALRPLVQVPFIVNDRLDVALAARADGVHLGQDDLPLAAARAVSRYLIIGVSTHNLAQALAAAGADYLGFGPVFATRTKENPDPVQGIAALAEVCAAVSLPVVAIGGVTPDDAAALAAAGAHAACAISSVNHAADPVAAARRVASAFD